MSFANVLAFQPLPHIAWPGATGYSEFPSLGLARLAHDMKAFGVRVRADHPRTGQDIRESLAVAPDVVVIGDFRYYAYFANPRFQVEAVIRELSNAGWVGPVIVAGRHASYMSSLPDTQVCTAGTYRELATMLTGLTADRHSLGADGDSLPGPGVPDMSVLADGADLPGSFSRPGRRMAQLVLSKGCPYRCAFCEKAGLPVSTMTQAELETTLEGFLEAGTERIIFWDEVFAWPHQQHAARIRAIADAGLGFNCNARLDSLRPDFVKQLAGAGCKEVLFGLELISELEPDGSGFLNLDLGKRRDVGAISDRIALLKDHGIAAVGSLIVGLPEDTDACIRNRIEIADSLGLSHCYVRPLVPFPESSLYGRLHRVGSLPDFNDWDHNELASFPHGYPTLSALPRAVLAAHCGR